MVSLLGLLPQDKIPLAHVLLNVCIENAVEHASRGKHLATAEPEDDLKEEPADETTQGPGAVEAPVPVEPALHQRQVLAGEEGAAGEQVGVVVQGAVDNGQQQQENQVGRVRPREEPVHVEQEEEEAIVQRRKRAKKSTGDYEAEQKAMKEAKTRGERYQLMVAFKDLPNLNNNFIKKVKLTFTQIQQCVAECHNGELDGFLAMKGNVAYGNYKCLCGKKKENK